MAEITSKKLTIQDTNWVTVNLQPDQPGPSQRTRRTVDAPTHSRAPPTQRLEDPTRAPHGYTSVNSDSEPPEGRKYYSIILDKGTAKELSLPRNTGCPHSYKVANVVTYKEPSAHPTWKYGRGAPAHGSQAPFHQRYSHYKYYGYAGAGAKTSWARNPKMQLLYDQ